MFMLLIMIGCAAQAPSVQRLSFDGLDKQRPAYSADGKRLAFARHVAEGTYGASIWQYVMEVGKPESAKRLTNRNTPEYRAVFSPDDARLLLVVVPQSGTQGNLDIAICDRDGSNLKTVAGDIPEGHLSHQDWPAWAPDGSKFAFSSTHEGNQEIYVADLDGKSVNRLTQSPGHDAHPCWTPDGRTIFFATDRWGGLEIASMNADGSNVTRITRSPGIDDFPAVAADGRRLAWVSNRDGNFEIYTSAVDGSSTENASNFEGRDTHPTWTPDSLGLTFVSDRDGGTDLYLLALPEPK
jgi:TolB protein